jgi:hypothetical protein
MRNMTPCPSPNGSNYERLFLVRERPDPRRRMAMDQQMQSGNSDLEDNIRELLAGKLDDADLEMLLKLITGGPRAQDRKRRMLAGDAMARHVQASLAKRAQSNAGSFLKRYPAAARMRVV